MIAAATHAVLAGQQAGSNVNIVKGTALPGGDPFLQRQTEPTIAVSTRNPCHLMASAVDYRTVDLENPSDVNPTQLAQGDAWLGVYKSFDCGQRWQSHLIPGFATDQSAEGVQSPLRGFDAGADGVVRAGSNGLFYYVGMVFQRDQSASRIFVSRFIDSNNRERGDTIEFAGTSIVATGSPSYFLDKPWIAVDIPRTPLTLPDTTAKAGTHDHADDKAPDGFHDHDGSHGNDDSHDSDAVCYVNGQRIGAGNVYVGWTSFEISATTQTSRIMFAKSDSCGGSWKPRPIFESVHARKPHDHSTHAQDTNHDPEQEDREADRTVQGSAMAIAPDDGTIYIAWRQFAENGQSSAIYFVKSIDQGVKFSTPQQLAQINGFDQERGLTTFRTNAMPTIAADNQGRVYVAWAERGFATAPGRGDVVTGDSRIVMKVSADRGTTWGDRYPIDDVTIVNGQAVPNVGHQVMPSLSFAAGKLHAIWYDFREDPCVKDPAKASRASCGATAINPATGVGVPNYRLVDGIDHLMDVRSASATPGSLPSFKSVQLSKYRTSILPDGTVVSDKNHANLPLYSQGTKSFIGDYIDAAGLVALPTRTAKSQSWIPNSGPLTTNPSTDPGVAPLAGFTPLPVFHAVWTDMRDVRPPANGDWTTYYPPNSPVFTTDRCVPDTTGMRDVNVYSSRVTPGVFVGSPGNSKPLGFVTRNGVNQHLQRAFVVFVQNTMKDTKYYRLKIMNQPGSANTDRASFRQFPAPPFSDANPSDKLHDPRIAPMTELFISVPPISTTSRTVYVTAADSTAQVRVDVDETTRQADPPPNGGPAPLPDLIPGGLRGSILLNPDPTNPLLVGPEVADVPDIAELEVHEPIVSDPIFYDIHNLKTRSTELRTPADQNPADQNPADQNLSDVNPADQNPADQNPADQNTGVEAVAFSDGDLQNSIVRDIHFQVSNKANTTTRYLFRPVVQSRDGLKFQFLVTVRNNVLSFTPGDPNCELKFRPQNQVLVNVSNYRPRTPADQNPADQNPADQNPADQNPADQNPADQNPADQNTAFFLAPGDQATVTLRVYASASTPPDELPSPAQGTVAAIMQSASVNTGQTQVASAAGGADLTVNEPPPVATPAAVSAGEPFDFAWTLKNRGTSPAVSTSGAVTTAFYLSLDNALAVSATDVLLATTSRPGTVPDCTDTTPVCAFNFVQPLLVPRTTLPGAYFIKVVTDPPDPDFPAGHVFEADKANNFASVPFTVVPFTLVFTQQPTDTTQDYRIGSAATGVTLSVRNSRNLPVTPVSESAGFAVSLAIAAGSPAGTLAGTTTVNTDATGTAAFPDLSIGQVGTAFRLAAGAVDLAGVPGNVTPSTSAAFDSLTDAPPVVANDSATTNEDFTLGSINVVANDSDPQTFGRPQPGRFVGVRATLAATPAPIRGTVTLNEDGTFRYVPNPSANGTDSFGYTANDGRAGNNTAGVVAITILSVNDAPSFTKGGDQSLNEDAGAQSVPNWATSISAGPANESGQAIDFQVSNSNNALFAVQPTVSAAGTLSYSLAPNANGSATLTVRVHDNGGTANGGIDTSAPQTAQITVAAINDPPSFTKGANQTVNEDAPAQSIANWATAISAGPVDENWQQLTFNVTNTNNALFSVQPAVSAAGTLTYTPAANQFGTATVTVQLRDDGGTESGGVDLSAAQTFTITVNSVNDVPSFTKGPNQGALRTAGAQSIANWATAISAGPANEAAQALNFIVSNTNNALFTVQPAVSPTGTLTFTPSPSAVSGSATVTIQIHDNGGTANGGVDTSAAQTFVISVTAVNAAPSFTKGADQTVAEDSGAQTVSNWATAISAGGPGDAGQTLDFIVSNNNNSLFTSQPAVSPTGTLTYAAGPNKFGAATVTVRIHDNGGTANGGVDTSAPQTFLINVTVVQDPPVAANDTASGNDGAAIVIPVLANDSDADNDTLTITFVSAPAGGNAVNNGNGTITYTSRIPFSGNDSFTYTISDGHGNQASAQVSVTITHTNHAPIAVNDSLTAIAGLPNPLNVLANDIDPDNLPGTVVSSTSYMPPATPVSMGFSGEVAFANGNVYVTGGNIGRVATFNPATNTITPVATLPTNLGTPSLSRVSAGFIYYRQGNNVTVFDTATNAIPGTVRISGTVQAMDVDTGLKRLYVLYQVAGQASGVPVQSGVDVFDIDPASATFLELIRIVPSPLPTNGSAIAANSTTGKVYVASSSGVWVIDGTSPSFPATLISGSVNSAGIAVNTAQNLVFTVPGAVNIQAIQVIDPQNSNQVSSVSVPGLSINNAGPAHRRIVVNNTTKRVYVRSFDVDPTHTGALYVIDGDRASPNFKTVLATVPMYMDNLSDDLIVDEGANLAVATASNAFKVVVIDGSNQVTRLSANHPLQDLALDPVNHRAFSFGEFALATIPLTPTPSLTEVGIGVEANSVIVDTSLHRAYIARTNGATGIQVLNKDGDAGTVSGLPVTAGRYTFSTVNSTTHRAYFVNGDSNVAGTSFGVPSHVAVVDTTTNSVIATVAVGNGAFGVGLNPLTNKVYVGASAFSTSLGVVYPAELSVIDGATNTRTVANTSAFETGVSFLREFVANTATNKIYFRVNGSPSGVTAGVLDGATNVATPLSTSFGTVIEFRVNPVLNRVYVGNSLGQVFVLNGNDHSVLATLSGGTPGTLNQTPVHIAVDTTNGRLFVSDFNTNSLRIFDSTNAPIATLPTGLGPSSVAVNETTHRVFVSNGFDNTITFVDGANAAVLGTLPTPLPPVFMGLDPSESRIYLSTGAVAPQIGSMVVADSFVGNGLSVGSVNYSGAATVSNSGNYVTFTPVAAGSDSFTYTASDGLTSSTPATATVDVKAPLTIVTTTLPEGTQSGSYDTNIQVTGGVAPYSLTITSGSLPSGLLLTPEGDLFGATPTNGTFTFTVTAFDSSSPIQQNASRQFTLVIGPLTVMTSSLNQATIDQPYNFTLVAGGSSATPLTWDITSGTLPSGLTLSSSGVLSGTANAPDCNSIPLTFRVRDSASPTPNSATRALSLFLTGPVRITTTAVNGGTITSTPNGLSSSCGSGTKTFTVDSGTLPLGTTLLATGGFTGTVRSNGVFPVTFRVTDSSGTATKAINVNIGSPDQQPTTGPGTALTISGSNRVAQTVTVGAAGVLSHLRFSTLTCSTNPLTVTIEEVVPTSGAPDDTQVLATFNATITGSNQFLALPTPIARGVDSRMAIVLSSTGTCTLGSPQTIDGYFQGSGYTNTGSGWTPIGTGFDVPVNTFIQNPNLKYFNNTRGFSRAVTLDDGRVLLVSSSTVAEIYDPANGSVTAVPMVASRFDFRLVKLADGRVLVAGGQVPGGGPTTYLASAEVFNPSTNTFSSVGSMSTARSLYAAVLLNNNKVLITGGRNTSFSNLSPTELFDPTSNSFSAGPSMATQRSEHTATLLNSGLVLVAGGFQNGPSSAELYDPSGAIGSFSAAGAMVIPRAYHTATLMANGTVLIAGGRRNNDITAMLKTAEIYTPGAGGGTFASSPAETMVQGRGRHNATLLFDGSVLLTNGFRDPNFTGPALASAERYVPGTGFVGAPQPLVTRGDFGTALLGNGRVFLGGGSSGSSGSSAQAQQSFELYDPGNTATGTPSIVNTNLPDGNAGVAGYIAILTATGGTAATQSDYTYQVVSGSLPPGLAFGAGSCTLQRICGTPTTSGSYTFGVRVTDQIGNSGTQTLRIRIDSLDVTSSTTLPQAYTGVAYNQALTASGLGSKTWTLFSGSLPTGLSLSSAGVVSGTTSNTGFFSFTVKVVDSRGQIALGYLNLSVINPLTITTTSLGPGVLFEFYNGCVFASNGVGTRTWSISAGALPSGVSINASNGCFIGQVNVAGTANFTVQVTDSSVPMQTATKSLSITTLFVSDQTASWDQNQANVAWGNTIKVAQRVIAGMTAQVGALRVQSNNLCPNTTIVNAEIQGVTTNGGPDGSVLASGSAAYPFNYITLNTPVLMAADQAYTIVFSANQACVVQPSSFDSNPGEGYVLDPAVSANWRRLQVIDGRSDIPFTALVIPPASLTMSAQRRGGHVSAVIANTLNPSDPNNGKVLSAGGGNETAEIYDPATNTVTATGSMSAQRDKATATALDDGTVLIAGGYGFVSGQTVYLDTAQLYHPDTGLFETVGTMTTARANHTATKMADGRVLITGGYSSSSTGSLGSAEIYTPASKTFAATGSMIGQRSQHAATLLDDGRVLVVGGYGFYFAPNAAELYDPSLGTFSATPGQMVVTFRARQAQARLGDGKILIAGGGGLPSANTAEIFNPLDGTFASAGTLKAPRVDHTATSLPDGSVLLSGGLDDTNCCPLLPPQASLERYVTGTGFVNAGSMAASRYAHTASRLNDGRVLFGGTWGWSIGGGHSLETYTPTSAVSLVSAVPPDGSVGAVYAGFTLNGQGGNGGPYTIGLVSASVAPGLTFSAGPNTVSGTPTQAGTFTAVFSVTDGVKTNLQTVTFVIDRLTITTSFLPDGELGVPYSQQLTASGADAKTWVLDPNQHLPTGLSLSSSGLISGTPTATGFSFTVRVYNSVGQTAVRNLYINVANPLAFSTQSPLPFGVANTFYVQSLDATNGSNTRTFALAPSSNPLPPGLTIQNFGFGGNLSGTLRRATTQTFTLKVTDSAGGSDTRAFTLPAGGFDALTFSGTTNQTITFGPGRTVAQTLLAGAWDPIVAVNANITCPSGSMTLEIRNVVGIYEPGTTVLASATFSQAQMPADHIYRLSSPLSVNAHSRYAVVFSNPTATCSIPQGDATDDYPFGKGFIDLGSGWTDLVDSNGVGLAEMPLAVVMDAPTLDYMNFARSPHQPVQLATGTILISGGNDHVEAYTASTRTLVPSSNSGAPRFHGTSTRLANGKLLIAGGNSTSGVTNTAEVYDPATGIFSSTGTMLHARMNHTATLLLNGNVLIAGGDPGDSNYIDEAELYNPGTNTFSSAGNMVSTRVLHQATLLPSGHVLITGGGTASAVYVSAEVYTPGSGFAATTGDMITPRMGHTATIAGGKVVIAGGQNFGSFGMSAAVEVYDPATDTFSLAGASIANGRINATSVTLNDGRVLLAGGNNSLTSFDPITTMEVIDPSNSYATRFAGNLHVARGNHVAMVICASGECAQQGRVLFVGGDGWSQASIVTLETFDPADIAPLGNTGVPFTMTLTSGAPSPTFSGVGSAPPGLTVGSNGVISGTPTVAGVYNFAVKVFSGGLMVDYRPITIVVN